MSENTTTMSSEIQITSEKLTYIKELLQRNLKCSENEANEYIDYMYGNPDHIREIIKKMIPAIENDRIEYLKSQIVDSPPNQFNIDNLAPMMCLTTWKLMDKPVTLGLLNFTLESLLIQK